MQDALMCETGFSPPQTGRLQISHASASLTMQVCKHLFVSISLRIYIATAIAVERLHKLLHLLIGKPKAKLMQTSTKV
jgi:hypothetical protein